MDSIPLSQRSLVTQRELEEMLTKLSENGIASVKLLRLIWSKFGFEEEHDNLMIKLLVSFNFAYVRCDNEHVIETVNALVEGNVDQGCDDLLGLLKEHNGDLLLPWFFQDKKPDGLPTVCPSDQSVSVCLTYSFSMSLPEGLFQRVSARCHRHSNSTHHWLSGVHMEYAPITAVLQCDEESAKMVLSASTVRSLNAYDRLWQVVWRLIIDIENEIKQAPGTVHTVQRYISASSLNGIQSVPSVGAREDEVQLHRDFPVFQMNVKDPIAREVENHKMAIANSQASVKVPLRSVLSPENGQEVTERQARQIAFLIDSDRAVSKLRFALKVKEADTVESSEVWDRALAVINNWRQSSSVCCISILRDTLHEVGLQSIDESVFGHIQDWALTRPEAGTASLSLPGIPGSAGKRSSSPGKESGRQPEQQADTPLSLSTQADKEVSSAQLVTVAEEIAGIWDELASRLSPELFPMRKIKEIERDHRSSFSQARVMLERWSKVFGRQATCRLLVQSLCQMGQREVAGAVFGTELVHFVEPL